MPPQKKPGGFTARKPDFIIRARRRDATQKGEIGAAWLNDDGTIYLKFNPYVTVPVGDDFAIAMFPQGIARVVVGEARPRDRFEGLDVPADASGKADGGTPWDEEA